MKSINTYLIFNGQCRQAMAFYQKCLGGVLYTMTYAEAPGVPADLPAQYKDWIIHARLTIKSLVLMASDTQPGMPVESGNGYFISLSCEGAEEIERVFAGLSEKGRVKMPLQETFYAHKFGMLTDQFGVQWMLIWEKPKE